MTDKEVYIWIMFWIFTYINAYFVAFFFDDIQNYRHKKALEKLKKANLEIADIDKIIEDIILKSQEVERKQNETMQRMLDKLHSKDIQN